MFIYEEDTGLQMGISKRFGACDYGILRKKTKIILLSWGKWRELPFPLGSFWVASLPFLFLPVSQSGASTIVMVEVN